MTSFLYSKCQQKPESWSMCTRERDVVMNPCWSLEFAPVNVFRLFPGG